MNFKIIYALWLRQIKKYLRSKPRMLGSLGQPLLFLVALGFGLGPIYQKAGGGNYLDFLVPGIIAMTILFTAIFNGIDLIWDRRFGFLKETLVAPVSRLDVLIGRTMGGATVAFFQGIIILLITLLLGFRPANLLLLLPAFVFMFLIGLLFTALGTAIATMLEDMNAFPVIINFVVMPIFFLSGALFPIESMPFAIKMIYYFNPLSYGVDGLRSTLVMTSHFGLGFDLAVILGVIAIIFGIGTYLFSKIEV